MKRIYKGTDLKFNINIEDVPINDAFIKDISFKFYTTNVLNFISKTKANINQYNQVLLEWNELSKLEEGILYYEYSVSLADQSLSDGSLDKVEKVMTNYFIMSGKETGHIDEGSVDLSDYYTKSEVDAKIDNIVTGDIDLSQYYKRTEVDNKFQPKGNYLESIPAEYVTDSELSSKGYLTQQSLVGYAKETWVNEEIAKAKLSGGTDIDTSTFATKSELNKKADKSDLNNKADKSEIPTKVSQLTNDKNYLTQHQSLVGYAKETWVNSQIENAKLSSDTSNFATKTELSKKADKSEVDTIKAEQTNLSTTVDSIINNGVVKLTEQEGFYLVDEQDNIGAVLTSQYDNITGGGSSAGNIDYTSLKSEY